MSKVIEADRITEKEVTNLGWILRHWKDVEWFEVHPTYGKEHWWSDATFCAHLRDGRRYVTEFADRSVLWDFLDRPIFRCVPVKWFGVVVPAGGLKYYKPDLFNYDR